MSPIVAAALVAAAVSLLTAALAGFVALTVARHQGAVDEKITRLSSDLHADLQVRLKIAEGRLPAYKSLWGCMGPVSLTSDAPLSSNAREDLGKALRAAFFDESGGLLLSHAALSCYIGAVEALTNEPYSDSDTRKKFSSLRTQMKLDLSVYTADEAGTSVRTR